ncbi:MAG: YbaN family protein [Bacteroidales bacterium]|nr:YbaN family protein [Bacteroidales bacterium]
MKKPLFIFLGTLSLSLGLIGIVVPGLPTTSFLLLAAYLYARSSRRLYNALLNHKFLGGYIKDFQKGMSVRAKIRAISMMWTMILISAFFFIKILWVQLVVIGVGFVGTFVMARLPGRKDED